MASGSRTFGVATLLTIVGLVVLLYGVSLNHGQALNTLVVAGGVIVVVGVGVLTGGVVSYDAGHDHG